MGKGKRGCFRKMLPRNLSRHELYVQHLAKGIQPLRSMVRKLQMAHSFNFVELCVPAKGHLMTKNSTLDFLIKQLWQERPKDPQFFFSVFLIFTEKQKAIPHTSKNTDYTTTDKWNMTILQFFPGFKPVWNKWWSSCHAGSPSRKKTEFRGNTAVSSITEHSGLHSPSNDKLVLGCKNWLFHNILKAQILI